MAEAEEQLLDEAGIARCIEALADAIRPRVDDETVAVCLLTGGLWFAADLTRALARRGVSLGFDALWLSSYGDGLESVGSVQVHGRLQRDMTGRRVLLMDDVLDTGASLDAATRLVRAAGAAEVLIAVFARKPMTEPRPEPDFVGFEAPARFLVGYGLDVAGRRRCEPALWALD